VVIAFVQGRWLRFAKSGFRRQPAEGLGDQIATLVA